MLKNYLIIALRNLKKHKGFSFINIAGLSVGIACSILVMIYVYDQLSYDRFHENAERTYRVICKGFLIDYDYNSTSTPYVLGKTLRDEYGDSIHVTQIGSYAGIVRIGNTNLLNERIIAADDDFLKVFSFPVLKGDPRSALAEPFTIILTESAAGRYFGNVDPMGKRLQIGPRDFIVTGLIRDVPHNSHIQFDAVVSIQSKNDFDNLEWLNCRYDTYVALYENFTQKALKEKLDRLVEQHINAMISSWKNSWFAFEVERLLDIHLHSDLNAPFGVNGKFEYVLIFGIIAIFVLIIACVNYVNLTTARFSSRAKEVGVRKVVGSLKSQLITQFLIESVLVCFIGTLFALLLVKLFLPFLSDIAGVKLEISYFNNPYLIPGLGLLTIFLGLFSGIYPAFYLSSFRPVSVLKGRLSSRTNKSLLRNGLVVFQFSISIFLIISTLVIYRQLDLLQNKNLGFSKEQVLVVRNAYLLGEQKGAFKNELREYANIQNVTGSSFIPDKGIRHWAAKVERDEDFTFSFLVCDHDFIETLGIELIKGRFFSKELSTDSSSIVLNEEAVKIFGGEDPIGKVFNFHERDFKVIGVVKNFHFDSLYKEVDKMGIVLPALNMSHHENFILARLNTVAVSETIDFVKGKWEEFAPNMPFEYSFLDEDYGRLYLSEQRTQKLSFTFTFLAIFISSLGMFGLASYTAELRTKEVGIRKVLGATASGLAYSLSKEFLMKVFIANILAWPAAYFLMKYWLQVFAYRTDLSIWIFILSGLAALCSALLTVSYQSIKAATANPADSLRYE
jgi:putative ABC transport system permease protein